MEKRTKRGWLEDKTDNPEFLRLCAREEFIEEFLSHVENEMKRTSVSRAELARRMECKPSNVTQMFRRTRNLTAATMVDIAFHLKLQLRVVFDEWNQTHARLLEPLWERGEAQSRTLRVREIESVDDPAVRPPLRVRSGEHAMETEWHTTQACLGLPLS
jgi:hypothetical protein